MNTTAMYDLYVPDYKYVGIGCFRSVFGRRKAICLTADGSCFMKYMFFKGLKVLQ